MWQNFTLSKVYWHQGQQTTPHLSMTTASKQNIIGTQLCPLTYYVLSMVAFIPQWQSSLVTFRTVCLKSSKILTIWLFTDCQLLV